MLVFVPCYNCAAQVGRVIAQLSRPTAPAFAEVMVVDNGSTDETVSTAIAALRAGGLPQWKVVRNRNNYNLGGSHKVAFNYAIDQGYTHVVVLHGDDQADIADFARPIAEGLHDQYDSLLGARFMPGARLQGYSLYRKIGNYGLNVICGLLLGRRIADQGSGLNLYSTRYLSSRFYIDFDNTLIFPNLMFIHGVTSHSKYKFIPISWREEDQRSNAKAVSQALRVIRLTATRRSYVGMQPTPALDYTFDIVESKGQTA